MNRSPPALDSRAIHHENALSNSQSAVVPHEHKVQNGIECSVKIGQLKAVETWQRYVPKFGKNVDKTYDQKNAGDKELEALVLLLVVEA